MHKSVVVIIPVHKEFPDNNEDISLKACCLLLKDYDCYLVYPYGMNVDIYLSVCPGLMLKPVDRQCLSSVENYNKMKLDISFYEMFKEYSYMLTYELDAFIFHSDFNKTGAFKYDYIGAPFFKGYLDASADAPFIKGGNSGFSLRKISACVNVLESMKKYNFMKFSFCHFPNLDIILIP
jgi:hypothetical protein